MDPNTTNAPLDALLEEVRPWAASAGGGRFLPPLARSPEAARALRGKLARGVGSCGRIYRCRVAQDGLRVPP